MPPPPPPIGTPKTSRVCPADGLNYILTRLFYCRLCCVVHGVRIFVITSFKDTCYIEILPKDQISKRVIFLSFWAEVHYNSIHLEEDVPASKLKKKKGWRKFRNKRVKWPKEY